MSTLPVNSVLDKIRQLHDNEESGTLTLRANGQRVDIFFREGMVEGASSNLSGCRIGDYLAKDGYGTVRDLDVLERTIRGQNISFGEAAVRKGLLTLVELGAAVRRQVNESLDHAFKNSFAVDSFKSHLRFFFAPAQISFPNALLELCRRNATPLEPATNVQICLVDGIQFSLFHWYPQELCVLSGVQSPTTFDRLAKTTGFQETNLKRMLGVLDGLGVIEVREAAESAELLAPENALVRDSEFSFERLIPVISHTVLNEKLQVAKNESSFAGEQFKNLKVQITSAKSENPLRILTVSSPDAQDGKSLISANLAFSFAMDPGRRIMIVDCDLRNPSLGDYLGVPPEPGLLQYLANGHLSPYCYVRRMQNLYFLTSGGVASNPVEILSMHKMKQLIEHLKRDFDMIILDAPPYFPIADARIVTGLSDGLIMVVRRGKTSSSSCDVAFKAVDRNKLLGVVFNDVQPMLFHTYYKFNYYQTGRNPQVYANRPTKIRNTPKNYLES